MNTTQFISSTQKDGSIIIHSGKELTIENAAAFARCLHEALAAHQQVTVEFAADVEADLTALQILCSACKTAAAEGKVFSRQGSQPESLRQLITAAGAERSGNCSHNHDKLCLWFGGN